MLTRSLCLSFIFLFFTFSTPAQNLVPNPSFEDNVSFDGSTFNDGCAWTSYVTGFGDKLEDRLSDWYQGGMSPDLFSICDCAPTGTGTFACDGYNTSANQTPRTGRHCIWMRCYWLADYIGVRLKAPLQAGQSYVVSFWASRSESADASDGLGIYFSPTKYVPSGFGLPSPAPVPQFRNATGNYITDTDNWTKIEGIYTASGGEQYMMLGYWEPVEDHTNGGTGADVFIDDVSIEPFVPLPITLVSFQVQALPNAVQLTWQLNPTSQITHFEVQKATDLLTFETIHQVAYHSQEVYTFEETALPTEGITYYRLKIVAASGEVTYSQPQAVFPYSSQFVMSPNPFHTNLTITLDSKALAREIIITDMVGKVIHTHLLQENTSVVVLSLPRIESGIYLLKVVGRKGVILQEKIVKQ